MKTKLLLVITLVCTLLPSQALAAPIAESFGYIYDYPYPGAAADSWAQISGPLPAPPPDDGNTLDSPINPKIAAAGYDARAFKNNSAYYVRRDMGGDALFLIIGHGAPGRISVWNGSQETLFTANDAPPTNVYSLQKRFQGTTELYDLRFAAYIGCRTALDDATYGNLLTKSIELGIDSALGFNNGVNIEQIHYYSKKLYGYLGAGYTVYDADFYAYMDCYNLYGYERIDGPQYAIIKGNSSVKITPAGYGSY